MYFCIENDGEVDVRAFRIMGMSSKGGSEKIGQFGTGNKYGIAAVIRAGLEIVVASGKREIKFISKQTEFRGEKFSQIFIAETGKKKVETTMTVEMGSITWTLQAALREFVSNAIDEGGFRWYKTEQTELQEGKTRIFIEWSSEVEKYFDNLEFTFLLGEQPIFKTDDFAIYRAKDSSVARIYRRGVEVYSEPLSCKYYYEFNSITLSESRLASRWDVRWHLGSILHRLPSSLLKEIVDGICDEEHIEGDAYLSAACFDSDNWGEVFGDKILVTAEESVHYRDLLFGRDLKLAPSELVAKLRESNKVKTINNVIPECRLFGWSEGVTVGAYEKDLIVRSIKFLTENGYPVSENDIIVANNSSENAVDGQYFEGKLYINLPVFRKGFDEVLDTIAHELFHHLSKAGDESRPFEDYLIKECLYHMKRNSI